MFGGGGFGEYGFSEEEYSPLDSTAFVTFLNQASAKRCWLIELDALSLAPTATMGAAFGESGFDEFGFSDAGAGGGGGVSTLRFSSHGYASRSTDSPASTYYEARLAGDVVVDRQISGRAGMNGITYLFAEATLVNRDGVLDTLLSDYSINGRRVRILLGDPDAALSTFGTVFTGVLQSATVGLDAMRLSISDGSAKLERKVNETAYTGAGALEGGDDLQGKFKPRAFGAVWNAMPPLVDSSKLIYQVNDGAINDVPNVYDRGIALTQGADYADAADMNATAPAGGQYRVLKSGGYFRLGSTPAGTVTADIEGDATGSYAQTTADICLRILGGTPALNSSEIDSTSFAQLNADAPATVGIWIGTEESRTCADVVDELLAGVGAFGGFNRLGAFSVKVLNSAAATSGSEDASYTRIDVLDLEREPLPAEVEPIIWRAGVGWQRNQTLQTDLAAAVTAARRTFLAAEQRVATTEGASIKSQHLLAQEFGPVRALYSAEADALTESARLYALWATLRAAYRLRLPLEALVRDLGDNVLVTLSRHGFSTGRNGRVIGYRLEGGTVELKILV